MGKEGEILQEIVSVVSLAVKSIEGLSIETLEQMISERNGEMLRLMSKGLEQGLAEDALDAKFLVISAEIRNLRVQQDILRQNQQLDETEISIAEIEKELSSHDIRMDEYNGVFIRRIIEHVEVEANGKLYMQVLLGSV